MPTGVMHGRGTWSHSFQARKAARLVRYQETLLRPWSGAHQLLVMMVSGLAEQ